MRAKYSNPKRKEYVSRAVSNALCEIMVEEKINQKEMAKRLKWNEPKVCRIIKRYAMPSAEDIYVIADAFKVSADYLIGNEKAKRTVDIVDFRKEKKALEKIKKILGADIC